MRLRRQAIRFYRWLWPTGFHARRWRLLTVWLILFTGVVAYALHVQRSESRRNDARFCAVTESFITSHNVLTGVLADTNHVQVQARRQEDAALRALQAETSLGQSANFELRAFLQSVREANADINQATLRANRAVERSIATGRDLRHQLQCD